MKAKNTMSKDLVIIDPSAGLREAFSLMRMNGIRHLPVVASDREIVGILSDRDIARAMQSTITRTGKNQVTESDEIPLDLKVTDFMSWPVIAFEKNSDIRDVATSMIERKISAVLIRSDDQIEGIITSEDLLKVLVKILSKEPSTPRIFISEIEDYFPNYT